MNQHRHVRTYAQAFDRAAPSQYATDVDSLGPCDLSLALFAPPRVIAQGHPVPTRKPCASRAPSDWRRQAAQTTNREPRFEMGEHHYYRYHNNRAATSEHRAGRALTVFAFTILSLAVSLPSEAISQARTVT